ncbi:MAG: hypothetical protein ACYC0X_21730 [Pirellulaceae bacterium]
MNNINEYDEHAVMQVSRRTFLSACGIVGATTLMTRAFGQAGPSVLRKFHFSTSCGALEADPELLESVARAGVTDLWLTGSWGGRWIATPKQIQQWCEPIGKRGLATHVINVPLGHPGSGPPNWLPGVRPDGSTHTGTSLHAPATEENCEAMRQIQAIGIDRVFLDDDFRLAPSPGVIGGCFCSTHKQEFLLRTGFSDADWSDLLDAVKQRRLTSTLRAWVEYTCDQLTACFQSQQRAAPNVQLGIMVMYLGAEKAGIRLGDYGNLPFRVGELMFDDEAFNPVKGKTDELFSSLFHRRFATPELAYSETTAYPDRRLSLTNKMAKLAVSTISDVRNTMFMCDFPKEHWSPLATAIQHHAKLHPVIAGHAPRGPLKHFWGEASRYVGDDNPYSLFLALGIPFEVTGELAGDGFTFLSDADARTADGMQSTGTALVGRPQAGLSSRVRALPESLPELFTWKREILPQLDKTPYVDGEKPVVCAWYPTARAVMLWNLSEQRQDVTLRHADAYRPVSINGLDVALIEGIDA